MLNDGAVNDQTQYLQYQSFSNDNAFVVNGDAQGRVAIGAAVSSLTTCYIGNTHTHRWTGGTGRGMWIDPGHEPNVSQWNYGEVLQVRGSIKEGADPGSGWRTHPWFRGTNFVQPVITAGTATVDNSATVYINGAMSCATANYAFYINSGQSYFGGSIGIGTTSPGDLLHVYGTRPTIRLQGGSGLWMMRSDDNQSHRFEIIDANGGYDKFAIYPGNTGAIVLHSDGAGNVGIGTASPDAKLHIHNTAATSDGDGSATETLSGQDSILLYGHDGSTNNATHGSITWLGSASRRRAMITAVAEHTDSDYLGLAFYTQGTDGSGDFFESMRISKTGNVGINTTAPGSAKLMVNPPTRNAGTAVQQQAGYFIGTKTAYSSSANKGLWMNQLHVADDSALAAGIGGAITFGATQDNTNGTYLASIEGSRDNATSGNYAGSMIFRTRTHGAALMGAHMVIASDGNVGMGTTQPEAELHVYRHSTGFVKIQNQSEFIGNTGGHAWRFYNYDTGGSSLWVSDGSTTSLIVKGGAGGDVGIGTASPTSRIHGVDTLSAATGNEVAYNLSYTTNKATSGDDTGLLVAMTNTASPGTSLLLDLQVTNGGGTKFKVDAGGNVTPAGYVIAGDTVRGSRMQATSYGSTTLPAFAFGGQTNYGFYRSGNDIRLCMNGADKVTVLQNGNVGIGTEANLNQKLTTYGATSVTTGPTTAIRCLGTHASVGGGTGIFLKSTTSHATDRYGAQIGVIRRAEDNGSCDLLFKLENTSANGLTERMRVQGDGNVGIGTTDPVDRLHLVSGGKFRNGRGVELSNEMSLANNQDYTFTIAGMAYGTAEFHCGFYGGGAWLNFHVTLGGHMSSGSKIYGATILANESGGNVTITATENNGNYVVGIGQTSGGTCYGSYWFKSSTYTDGAGVATVTWATA